MRDILKVTCRTNYTNQEGCVMKFDIPDTMKAVVLEAYDKLNIVEMPVPKPGPGEVLCRIKTESKRL